MVISVLVSTRNYADYLGKAIDSLLEQKRPPDEIIVSDNGSTDHSLSVLKNYSGKIRILENGHHGQMAGLNAAYAESTGSLLCLLDGDDYFYPDKLQVLESLFHRSFNIDEPLVLSHWMDLVDKTGRKIGRRKPGQLKDYWGKNPRRIGNCYQLSDPAMTHAVFHAYGYPHLVTAPTSGILMTRAMADLLFPLPVLENIKSGADNYLVRGACLNGPCYFYDGSLAAYREHDSNIFHRARPHKGEPDRTELHLSVETYLQTITRKTPAVVESHYLLSGYALAHHKKKRAWPTLLYLAAVRLKRRSDHRNWRLALAALKAVLWDCCFLFFFRKRS